MLPSGSSGIRSLRLRSHGSARRLRLHGGDAIPSRTIPLEAFSPPPHVHYAHEEGFYVLEGALEFMLGTETVRAEAGAWVLAPIGVPHTFRNTGDTPARFLGTFTPDRYIRYFDELAALINASGQLSLAQAAEVMARYDTEVVGGDARG